MHTRRRKKPYYVTKYYDIKPKGMDLTWRVIARTKEHAKKVLEKRLRDNYQWRPQVWKEFKASALRLATVKRWLSPEELKRMHASGEVIAKTETRG